MSVGNKPDNSREIALSVQNLVVHYQTDDGDFKAVNDISFELAKGATMGLVGETGAGKTTTALALMRLIPDPPGKIISGKIMFSEKDILEYREKEMNMIRGNTISMVFQDPMTSLNPVLSVGKQIAEVIALHQNKSDSEAMKAARDMLELVGISGERINEYPHQFSGGMKQRVVIAMAIACNPEILIADEPTTALDVTIQAQVLRLIRDLKDRYGTTTIMITHDLGVVAEVCDSVSIMYAGRIVEKGDLVDIFNNHKHPYTEGLFGALPNLQKRDEKLKPIAGMMPDPSNLPSGCFFHPRCKYAREICQTTLPEEIRLSGTHSVECHMFSAKHRNLFDNNGEK